MNVFQICDIYTIKKVLSKDASILLATTIHMSNAFRPFLLKPISSFKGSDSFFCYSLHVDRIFDLFVCES